MSRDPVSAIDPGAITTLLPPHGACGPTCHPGANTNLEWLLAEQDRLAAKGDDARIAAYSGFVFLTRTGEAPERICP